MLFPDRCAACGTDGPSPCGPCAARFRIAPRLEAPPPLVWLVALLAYEGAARTMVAGLKYRGARSSVSWLADGLAGLVRAADVHALTWAPTSLAHRRARGFDHARTLARAVGRRSEVPVLDLLERHRGPPQTGLSRAERLIGPRVSARRRVNGLRVAVIDDVVTTGATLSAAARALDGAGAAWVGGFAAAATPGWSG